MPRKTQIEFLRDQLKKARNFIHAMKRHATGYGSSFSEGVVVDCEAFFRDNPAPRESTHVVVSKAYLSRLQSMGVARLQAAQLLEKKLKTKL